MGAPPHPHHHLERAPPRRRAWASVDAETHVHSIRSLVMCRCTCSGTSFAALSASWPMCAAVASALLRRAGPQGWMWGCRSDPAQGGVQARPLQTLHASLALPVRCPAQFRCSGLLLGERDKSGPSGDRIVPPASSFSSSPPKAGIRCCRCREA